MGAGSQHRRPLAWQGTLAQMKRHGTRIAQTCGEPSCRRWSPLNVDNLIAEFGPDHMLWDRQPVCSLCGKGRTWFLASSGPSTVYRPLLSGPLAEAARRDFLRGFGFTKRDVRRIRAMAEAAAADTGDPVALDDLDVPYRVGCCHPGRESYTSGKPLGEWAGQVLLWWPMNSREEEVWRRKRRAGPKAMP